jgi:hypothetical protein
MGIVAARQWRDGIEPMRGLIRNADGHRTSGGAGRDGDGVGGRRSAIAGVLLGDAGDGVRSTSLRLRRLLEPRSSSDQTLDSVFASPIRGAVATTLLPGRTVRVRAFGSVSPERTFS